MKLLHLGSGDDLKYGFDNLDPKINGWTFEQGLPYPNNSVDGITISHALSQLPLFSWLGVFKDFYMALRIGGVVRITDDDTESPDSPRCASPYPGVASLTGSQITRYFLGRAGFDVYDCSATETQFVNDELLIAHREHKVPRYVFYIEGVKQ